MIIMTNRPLTVGDMSVEFLEKLVFVYNGSDTFVYDDSNTWRQLTPQEVCERNNLDVIKRIGAGNGNPS